MIARDIARHASVPSGDRRCVSVGKLRRVTYKAWNDLVRHTCRGLYDVGQLIGLKLGYDIARGDSKRGRFDPVG